MRNSGYPGLKKSSVSLHYRSPCTCYNRCYKLLILLYYNKNAFLPYIISGFTYVIVKSLLALQTERIGAQAGEFWQHRSLSPSWSILLLRAIVVFAVFVNTVASKSLAQFERLTLVLHILGAFAICRPLVSAEPYGDGSIFNFFSNARGWSTGVSHLWLDCQLLCFSGWPVYSQTVSRLGIWLTLHGILGFVMLVTYLFCPGDPAAALDIHPYLPFSAALPRRLVPQ